MKYRCQTQGCAKFGIVYDRPDYDGSDPLDCTLCGEATSYLGGLESTPEPETAPMSEATVISASTMMGADIWVRESISQLWDRARNYSAEDGPEVNRIVLAVVQLVLDSVEHHG